MIVTLDGARTAIAKAALIAEDRADSYQSMGFPVAVDQARREADRLWKAAFQNFGADGAEWDSKRPL